MSRAWPFEHKSEGIEPIRTPEQFIARNGEGTEAVVIRIGLHDAQLVLVGPSGAWQRWVHPSVEAAEHAARAVGVPVHVGEYPEATRVRINALRRPAGDFDRAAYPEQGEVGPVIAYPENRPRQKG
jgi:uncharacterized protein (DUF2126 family)